ncbi:alpha/beta hydrolase [Kitasatospora sp. NPDC089797]|uniref:alpha/beta hydrolase n=1 Tax=Kitasatospora sp. NPDC089797 TaxID=3155298 RepID=UPI00344880A3
MDIKTLHDADFCNLAIAKTAFDTLSTAFGGHVENWQHEVVDRLHNSQWSGTAADHATTRIQNLHDELHAAQQEIALISRALQDAGEGFAAAQAHLISALDDAKAQGLTVAADGTITWDNNPDSATYLGDGPQKAQQIRDRITAAVTEADHADRTISSRLAHLTTNASNGTGLDATVATNDTAAANALSQIPDTGTDPNAVAAWWNSLTDEQQHRMVLNHPAQIGNLDGIPATGRDQANRINLARARTDLQHQLDGLGPEPDAVTGTPYGAVESPMHKLWKQQHDDLTEKLGGIDAIDKRLNTQVDAAHPPAYLLGFDTDGKGHAIVAINNPDTADNVSTYVPGTGARLGKVDGDIDRSDKMVAAANAANSKRTTSSISWIGYDAPQKLLSEASDDQYAKDAEDKLHGFEVGLHATHNGNISNNTILGHSYGTTTIGYTMKDKGLPVDNVVLIASPGAGVDTAKDLHIDPSHVYAAQSQADMIGMAAAMDPGGAADNAWDNLRADFGFDDGDHHLIHGRQTTTPQFGATVLPTNPDGGHSDYWNDGSPTLAAMGQVIAGK